jgi:predicted transcriptional regulator
MNSVEKVKAWISPLLITAFGVVFWSIISEIKTDVKMLLRSTAQSDVKIENLERRVNVLEGYLRGSQLFAIKPEEIELPRNPYAKRS